MINSIKTTFVHALSALTMLLFGGASFIRATCFFGLTRYESDTNMPCWLVALALSGLCGLSLWRAWEFHSIACDALCELPFIRWAAKAPTTINP